MRDYCLNLMIFRDIFLSEYFNFFRTLKAKDFIFIFCSMLKQIQFNNYMQVAKIYTEHKDEIQNFNVKLIKDFEKYNSKYQDEIVDNFENLKKQFSEYFYSTVILCTKKKTLLDQRNLNLIEDEFLKTNHDFLKNNNEFLNKYWIFSKTKKNLDLEFLNLFTENGMDLD